MSFTKHIVTQLGLELNVKLIEKSVGLEITRVIGGDGYRDSAFDDMTDLVNPLIEFQVLSTPKREGTRVTLPIYLNNDAMTSDISLTEIGVFAKDPDVGEILYSVSPAYDSPLILPPRTAGRVEITCDLIFELSNDTPVTISVMSLVYLTRPEADSLYAPKLHRHLASEIDETTGETSEIAQRRQDAEIELLKKRNDQNITSAKTVIFDALTPTKWRVLDDMGFYDSIRKLFCA